MKKLLVVLLCLSLVAASAVFAEAYPRPTHDTKGMCGGRGGECGFPGRFHSNAWIIMKNAEELGLSAEQKASLEKQEYDMRKSMIKTRAEIDLVRLDISNELRKEEVNADAVKTLIDKKHQLEAQKEKDFVDWYIQLENTLTPEQKEKLEALHKDMKRCMGRPGEKEGGHMPGEGR